MIKKLGTISKINFGLYQKAKRSGELPYLQVSQFDLSGNLKMNPWENYVPHNEQTDAALLKPGQIVLAGKGHRLFAWAYRPECGSIVPSSVFFVIEPDPSLAIPEYLTIFLNLPKQRTFFHALGAGTNIPSIRKSELANMSILLPPLETQKQIVTVSQLHKQELVLMEQLRTQKQALLQSLITQLIQQ